VVRLFLLYVLELLVTLLIFDVLKLLLKLLVLDVLKLLFKFLVMIARMIARMMARMMARMISCRNDSTKNCRLSDNTLSAKLSLILTFKMSV
jgi:hypothetical protein